MVTSDPFLEMIQANKTYGFTIAVKELKETVPNIFRYASAYKRVNKIVSKGLWEMFIEPEPEEEEKPLPDTSKPKQNLPQEILQTEPGHQLIQDVDPEAMEGEKYNMCHFWSNFEIARLDWFRSKEYNEFFEMMDRSGGFWMERVSHTNGAFLLIFSQIFLTNLAALFFSGVTHPFTPWPLALSLPHAISTTFATLAIVTPPFNTALLMRPRDNCRGFHILSGQQMTRRNAKRRTSTGRRQIQ